VRPQREGPAHRRPRRVLRGRPRPGGGRERTRRIAALERAGASSERVTSPTRATRSPRTTCSPPPRRPATSRASMASAIGCGSTSPRARAMYGATRDAASAARLKRRILLDLRTLGGVLRRLLPEGAEGSHARASGLRGGLPRRPTSSALPRPPRPPSALGREARRSARDVPGDITRCRPASRASRPSASPAAPTRSPSPWACRSSRRPLDEATMFAVAAACEAAPPCASPP